MMYTIRELQPVALCALDNTENSEQRFSPPPAQRGNEDDPGSVGTSSSADGVFVSFPAVSESCQQQFLDAHSGLCCPCWLLPGRLPPQPQTRRDQMSTCGSKAQAVNHRPYAGLKKKEKKRGNVQHLRRDAGPFSV